MAIIFELLGRVFSLRVRQSAPDVEARRHAPEVEQLRATIPRLATYRNLGGLLL